ncbi:MAG: DUF1501 domain-containing protein [Aquabacterium sp.]
MSTHHQHRRAFLQRAAGLVTTGAALPLGLSLGAMTRAAAQSTGNGYKALVCIFLSGGNDAFNTVLATDTGSWGHYNDQRCPTDGSTVIALPAPGVAANLSAAGSSPDRLGGVLPISHAGRTVNAGRQFALHPALTRTQQMYQAGNVAVLANVGPLTRPTTKADYQNVAVSKPTKLYSHNDQQSTWQTLQPEGATPGWGGLMGDNLRSINGSGRSPSDADLIQRLFTCMTPSTAGPWLAGQQVLPYQSSLTSILGLGSAGTIYGNAGLQSAAAAMLGQLNTSGQTTIPANNLFLADHQRIVQRALKANDLLGASLSPLGTGPWSTSGVTDPNSDNLLKYTSPVDGTRKLNGLALQLQMVARLIDLNRTANLGMTRQLFMVNLGGFDTHANQISDHADRMAQLDHAMSYFDAVLRNMPSTGDMRGQVTTFTASEFGRSFTSNGDGTDHGWGGHHFIMGGAVRGTDVYGAFPQYSSVDSTGSFSSPDQLQNGVLLPTTAVEHYAYTLGKWMDVPDAALRGFLPNLSQFDSATYNLGFLNT